MSLTVHRIHRYDQQHAVYMHVVAEELRKFMEQNNISGEAMTADQAEDFLTLLKTHDDSRINLVIVRSFLIEEHVSFRSFERISRRIREFLGRFGREDAFHGDFWLLEDHWGCAQVLVHVINLDMLRPEVIHGLRALLRRYPDWEIVVAVAPNDHLYDWPAMGLYIRKHEIIDGLLRDYFPQHLQSLQYERARLGNIDE